MRSDVGVCGWPRQFIKPWPVISRRTHGVGGSDHRSSRYRAPPRPTRRAGPGPTRLARWSDDRRGAGVDPRLVQSTDSDGTVIEYESLGRPRQRLGPNHHDRRWTPCLPRKQSVIRLSRRNSLLSTIHGRLRCFACSSSTLAQTTMCYAARRRKLFGLRWTMDGNWLRRIQRRGVRDERAAVSKGLMRCL